MDPYEWDDAKNEANRLKHGVGFELVYELDWSAVVIKTDDRFDYGEERALAYGRIAGRGYAIVLSLEAIVSASSASGRCMRRN